MIAHMIRNDRFNQWLSAPLPAWTKRAERALPRITVSAPDLRGTRRLAAMLVARPLFGLAVFVAAAAEGEWVVAVVSTWLVYGSALTCVHHLIHGSLGLLPRARHAWLRVIGMLVVESGHALQVTHLAHHRSDAEAPDPEGYIEYVPWRRLPAAALAFRYRLMVTGLRMAPAARRRRIVVEIAAHAAAHLVSLALLPFTIVPWAYLSLIHLASFGFAVLAGKGPQTNYGRDIPTPLVRVHTGLGRILFFSHDQHLEHHAAPKVPLPHLRRIRHDIDTALAGRDIFDVRMPL